MWAHPEDLQCFDSSRVVYSFKSAREAPLLKWHRPETWVFHTTIAAHVACSPISLSLYFEKKVGEEEEEEEEEGTVGRGRGTGALTSLIKSWVLPGMIIGCRVFGSNKGSPPKLRTGASCAGADADSTGLCAGD